jgi:hypothetical protein
VLAGSESSAHDASILPDSLWPDGSKILDGKFYLGDVGYACQPRVLPPFRKTRYHLMSLVQGSGYGMQKICSILDSQVLVTIEMDFVSLNYRFKLLNQKPFHT